MLKKKVAAIIPARGGSVGVKNKNTRLLAGKPLIVHTIEQALASESVSNVYVTTDSTAIAEVSRACGAEVIIRPQELAADTSTSESALQHAQSQLQQQNIEFDYWVFLQCTSPIRSDNDIENAIQLIQRDDADSLLSVVENHGFLWRETAQGAESINYDFRQRPRRQDMELQFQENGSIYIYKPWVLNQLNNRLGGKISLYTMAQNSMIDIDTEWDFMLAGNMMGKKC